MGRTFRELAEKRVQLRRELNDITYDIAEAIVRALRPIIPNIDFYNGGDCGKHDVVSFYDAAAGSEGRKFNPECGMVKPFDEVVNKVFADENVGLAWFVDFESPDFYLTEDEAERVREALKNMIRYADIDAWL